MLREGAVMADIAAQGGERNEHCGVLEADASAAHAPAGRTVILEHAADGEGLSVDRDDAIQGVDAAREQGFGDGGTDDHDLRLQF